MRLYDQIKTCQKCPELAATRKNVVIGEGSGPSPCIFIGEAPGEKEDETGRPFVGRAGTMLRTCMSRVGFKPGEYNILNCLKCRPPENRSPTDEELKNCLPFLAKQIDVIRPKVLVALGRYAQAFVLGEEPGKIPVVDNGGRVVYYKGDIAAILTFHPSYVSRHSSDEIYFAFLRHINRAYKLSRGKK